MEKIIDGIIETGESTLFVGWETKIKSTRRAQTLEEQLLSDDKTGFVLDEKIIYDNIIVPCNEEDAQRGLADASG